MKLKTWVSRQPITVMIESSTTHNFISAQLVSQLQIAVETTPTFGVKLGNGHRVESFGRCHNIRINLGPIEMSADLFIFPLGSVDLILGMAWLESLRSMQIN